MNMYNILIIDDNQEYADSFITFAKKINIV
jgi:hypothetical protein